MPLSALTKNVIPGFADMTLVILTVKIISVQEIHCKEYLSSLTSLHSSNDRKPSRLLLLRTSGWPVPYPEEAGWHIEIAALQEALAVRTFSAAPTNGPSRRLPLPRI